MMSFFKIFVLSSLIFLSSSVHSQELIETTYVKSPYVDQEIWDSVLPYLLPEDHPIKPQLDRIFSISRASENRESLKAAGFKNTKSRRWSHVVVTKHPKLKGYLLKLYTDEQENVVDWIKWKSRIKGAMETQKVIDEYGFHDIFIVPKKWIYPLPAEPSPSSPDYERKNFILVVEDVHVLPSNTNLLAWKSPAMTVEKLDAIYTVLKKVGLWDTVYAFNLPFTKEGKLAFIDTEFYHRWPVHYSHLTPYLSDKMQVYWRKLIAKKRKPKH